jgi:AcrR family transcriptional regulator
MLVERPIQDLSLDEIAVKAGISGGLFFHYFPNKTAYYTEVLATGAGVVYLPEQRLGHLQTESLPQVFHWARSVDPVQPLTSAVWNGNWGDRCSRSAISGIQLDNADVITFHCHGKPAEFEARITELSPLGRPILCTEYPARPLGSTVEGILPIAKRHNVGALNWGFVAGKTQTYLLWDSWDHPYRAAPKVWFSDLVQPDGRPYQDSEIQTIRRLIGGLAATYACGPNLLLWAAFGAAARTAGSTVPCRSMAG